MIQSQMLKGTLEGCILEIVRRLEIYGYEISQELKRYGFGEISDGTIYPLLMRLEKNGCITATYRSSAAGPRRKYYAITQEGDSQLRQFRASWGELSAAVNLLFRELLRRGLAALPAALACWLFGAVLYLAALSAQGVGWRDLTGRNCK